MRRALWLAIAVAVVMIAATAIAGQEVAPPPVAQAETRGLPGGLRNLVYPIVMLGLMYAVSSRRSDTGSGWGTYYLFWFVAPLLVSVLVSHPAILLIVPAAIVLRPWLPDPVLWLRTLGRVRALSAAAEANVANVTARRDLAKIWIEQRRPRRVLPIVDEALARDPRSAELHHLRGLALAATGDHEKAVREFIEVTHLDPRFGYGEPYLHAGDSLMSLSRWEDAEDAFDRLTDAQGSSVEGWYKLSRARVARGDRPGAAEALRQASLAYRQSPGFHRRKHFGWYLRARLRSFVAA